MAKGGKPGGGGGGGGGDSGGGSTWRGGNGDDIVFVLTADELATTTYDGRRGFDTLDMSEMTTGVTIKLNNSGGDSIVYPYREHTGIYYSVSLSDPEGRLTGTIKNMESLVGGSGNDFLMIDSSGAKTIDGGPGNDALGANGGSATLIGGSGSDNILAYWSDNILVGGTYENGVATPDGESDTFIFGGSGTVLDFELGTDRLQVELIYDDEIDAFLAAEWANLADGTGAQLVLPDGRTITLVGLTALEASAIPLGFVIGDGSPEQTGGPGDDTFYASNSADERFVLPSGSGNDMILFFDTSNDTLVFPDGAPTSWVPVDVNGQAGLRGVYDNGNSSVILLGLTDAGSLMIEDGSTDATFSSTTSTTSTMDGMLL